LTCLFFFAYVCYLELQCRSLIIPFSFSLSEVSVFCWINKRAGSGVIRHFSFLFGQNVLFFTNSFQICCFTTILWKKVPSGATYSGGICRGRYSPRVYGSAFWAVVGTHVACILGRSHPPKSELTNLLVENPLWIDSTSGILSM
jgi:hypothetical protein